MTIKQALNWATNHLRNIDTAQLDAELLLLHSLSSPLTKRGVGRRRDGQRGVSLDKSWLYSHPDNKPSNEIVSHFKVLINRRAQGIPVAYLTNHKEFYGLDFYVDERVLIPRPESELLVALALKQFTFDNLHLTNNKKRSMVNGQWSNVVIDVGTGSGCIIISAVKSLAANYKLQATSFFATDSSPTALEVAKLNAKRYYIDKQIQFLEGNLLEPVIESRIKNPRHEVRDRQESSIIICANLPYLRLDEANPSIAHEPPIALYSDDQNGLTLIEELLNQISTIKNLSNVKCQMSNVILEHSPTQTSTLTKLAKATFPQAKVVTKKDLAGLDRVTIIKIT